MSVHAGDVCDSDTVSAILSDQDVVISCLGPRSPRSKACSIYARSADSFVPAVEKSQVKRLLVTSTALLFPPATLLDRVLRLIARNNFQQAGQMEPRIRQSSLQWTIARSGFLNSNDETKYRTAEDCLPENGKGVSRAALAKYLYNEAKNCNHERQIVGIST